MATHEQDPVRVVLRTSSTVLTKIDTSLDDAIQKLEQQFHTETRDNTRFTNVSRVLTRLSDKRDKRGHRGDGDRVELVFDSPGTDTITPKVVVYRVTVKGSHLCFKEVFRPGVQDLVNGLVDTYKRLNRNPGLPETIDMRRQTRIQRGLAVSN